MTRHAPHSTASARPVRRRKPVLLIIGCGDVGMRVARQLMPRWRVLALTSSPERIPALRALGIEPLSGNLDEPQTLVRAANLADRVLHLAPPPMRGVEDPRTLALVRALARGGRVSRLVYGSTTGVYGDCSGQWIDETWPTNAQTDRAQRRVHAESQLRRFGRRSGVVVSILRIPGIYAPDRAGGQPQERLLRRAPVLQAPDDVFTNHIHADDLARACARALLCGAPQRVYNICDDSDLPMGDHYDRVAELSGLPRPPRMSRDELRAQVSSMQWSFMSESRRIRNDRLKRELKVCLRWPTIDTGLFGSDASAR